MGVSYALFAYLGPFLGGESVWGFNGNDARTGPLYISTVVPPVAVVEEQHVVVSNPGVFLQLPEMLSLVVWVYLAILDDFVHH